MNTSVLIRLFGWRATLIYGDTTVVDRWRWLKRRLPRAGKESWLIDIGCGTGAFTIGAAKQGYHALGLSWDERNQCVARLRAIMSETELALFDVLDARSLNTRSDLQGKFDVAVLCEVIEHVINDVKLVQDAANCLRPGGVMLLTTPNANYRAITKEDEGPFLTEETGWHVRKGYRSEDLQKLADCAGLSVEEISFCSGFLSQKITGLLRVLSRVHLTVAWVIVLPLRILPPILDNVVTAILKWPKFSICIVARKPSK
jgi:SAM-dependent methyltransferase